MGLEKLLPQWFHKILKKKEKLLLFDKARLIATDPLTGRIVKVIETEDLVVTVGKNMVGDMLIDTGVQFDTGLTYCALGSDNTAPAIGQTQLVDEGGGAAMRKTITSRTRLVNVITLSTFFTAAQSTLAIEEAGIFGSSTAGVVENSGIMFSRWLASFDNTGGLYDITISYLLTIS